MSRQGVSLTHALRRIPAFAAAALAAPIALTACGGGHDASAPAPTLSSVDVQLTLGAHYGPLYYPDNPSAKRVVCNLELRASSIGSGSATWRTATVTRYWATDRAKVLDTWVMSSDSLRSRWGSQAITAPGQQTSDWEFWSTDPFRATIDFRYGSGDGAEKTASVSFDCAPSMAPNVGAPAVSNISAHSATADLEPGGTLSVSYSATSPWGVLRTTVDVRGPCALSKQVTEGFAAGLEVTVTRTVDFQIPASCLLNVPFSVAVRLEDGTFGVYADSSATSVVVVDKTPPSLDFILSGRSGDTARTSLIGDFFAGEEIHLRLWAYDNRGLAAIVWEIQPAGFRDSVLVSNAVAYAEALITVRQAWAGAQQLRVFARDEAGVASAGAVSPPDGLHMYPTATRPMTSATVSGEVRDEVFDATGDVLYVLQPPQHRVAAISLPSLQTLRTFPLPSAPTGIDLDSGGNMLVVALPEQRALGVIDLAAALPSVRLLSLTALDPSLSVTSARVRMASNGKALVLVTASDQPAQVIDVDLSSGAERTRLANVDVYPSIENGVFERSHDRSVVDLMASQCVIRYDAATDRFDVCRVVRSGLLTIDATGERSAIGLHVYDPSWREVQPVESPSDFPELLTSITPDGSALYSMGWSIGVVCASVADGHIIDRMLNPVTGPGQLRISPSGRWLVTVARGPDSSLVSVFDLR